MNYIIHVNRVLFLVFENVLLDPQKSYDAARISESERTSHKEYLTPGIRIHSRKLHKVRIFEAKRISVKIF